MFALFFYKFFKLRTFYHFTYHFQVLVCSHDFQFPFGRNKNFIKQAVSIQVPIILHRFSFRIFRAATIHSCLALNDKKVLLSWKAGISVATTSCILSIGEVVRPASTATDIEEKTREKFCNFISPQKELVMHVSRTCLSKT